MKLNFSRSMKKVLGLLYLILLFISCQDEPLSDYISQYYVEAFLIVDEPIDGIKIYKSQPIQEKFDYSKAFVKGADVSIIVDGKDYKLVLRDIGKADEWAYFLPDTNIKVLPKAKYDLRIITPDGVRITGTTITPSRFDWQTPPPDTIYYPKDSVNFTDKDPISIRWTPVKEVLYYVVSLKCLDTLEYGKYLSQPTQEKNRRVYAPFDENRSRSRYYYDLTSWDAIPNTEYPLYWLLFKWFGKHKIIIYSPDFNFLRWLLQQFRGSQINPLLSSVDGAIGVFGSASKIEKEIFLVKNQP